VPEAEFRAGRAEVLQMFMDRPRIYKVDAFRNKYEVTARKNLERALAELKQ
jgi:predicted metal-dependent HD superfamily phosphohydrolase